MKENLLSVVVAGVLMLGFFFMMGGSLDTVTTGHWATVDDGHPEGEHSESYLWQ